MAPVDACLLYGDPTLWGMHLLETSGEFDMMGYVDGDEGVEVEKKNITTPRQQERRKSLSFTYLKLILSSVSSLFSYSQQRPPKTATIKKEKKFVLQSAEFYGADFSPPVENPEIVNLRPVMPLDDEQVLEMERERREKGTVFINALSNVVVSRSLDWVGGAGGELEMGRDEEGGRRMVIGMV